jgi:hypothetical protein
MKRSRSGRDLAATEALLKLGFFGLLFISLAVGGITGFANVLAALVQLAIAAVVLGGFGWLVIVSRLYPLKKTGMLALLIALAAAGVWRLSRPPAQWPAEQATVVQLTAPTLKVTATYRYAWANVAFDHVVTSDWRSLEEAKKRTPTSLTLWVNPARPDEAVTQARANWKRLTATLASAEPRQEGGYSGKAQVGHVLTPRVIDVQGPFLEGKQIGSRFWVYRNPLNPAELSLEPRATEATKTPASAWIALLTGLVGLGCLVARPKEWLVPRSTAQSQVPAAAAGGQASTAELLRRIDWLQFEKVSARILELEGWRVTRRGGANPDGGADLVAERGDLRAVVQCKHWKNWEIPPKVLRELLGTKVSTGFVANYAILFTLSPCTAESRSFAAANGIEIFDADRITSAIDTRGLANFPELLNPDNKECPKCGAPMVIRVSGRGQFWGCTQYPSTRCKGRFELDPDAATPAE